MKLSAILFSVNLVAVTMPLAAQAEEAVSMKADWLKKSIAEIETSKKPASRPLSISDPGITPPAKGTKLRAFVANRKLPSAQDLQLSALRPRLDTSAGVPTLTAQQAVMGQMPGQPLSAQISTYAMAAPNVRPATVPLPAAPRAVATHVPSLPGQITSRSISASAIPVIPEPPGVQSQAPAYMNLQPPAPKVSRLPASIQPERLIKQAGALLVQSPCLSPDQRHLVDELVQLNKPGRSNDFIDVQGGQPTVVPSAESIEESPINGAVSMAPSTAPMAGHSDLGPPPFPLNLLPQDQLQAFVQRRNQQKINAPHVYFGSWHRQAQAQNVAPLPYAGFQTHLVSRRILATNYAQYATRIGGNSNPHRSKRTVNAHRNAVSHQTVAVYPAYENTSRVSMF